MLPTINFDDEPLLTANEVANIPNDRLLPDELISIDPSIADTIPENRLRIRLIGTQSPRESDGLFVVATHLPCPSPGSLRDPTSPRKERGEVEGARGVPLKFDRPLK